MASLRKESVKSPTILSSCSKRFLKVWYRMRIVATALSARWTSIASPCLSTPSRSRLTTLTSRWRSYESSILRDFASSSDRLLKESESRVSSKSLWVSSSCVTVSNGVSSNNSSNHHIQSMWNMRNSTSGICNNWSTSHSSLTTGTKWKISSSTKLFWDVHTSKGLCSYSIVSTTRSSKAQEILMQPKSALKALPKR